MTNDDLDIPEEADRLFELPLDEFVSERKLISSALRDAGRRAEAQSVSKLPKPTVAAWAANQIIRSQRRDIGRLLEAGAALERAQEAVVSGAGDTSSLRDASQHHRNALDQLTRALHGLLDAQGHSLSDAAILRARDTLAAISLDPRLRRTASCGRLTEEHSFSGGFELGAPPVGDHPRGRGSRGRREAANRPRPASAKKSAPGRKPAVTRQSADLVRVREAERAEREATEAAERAAREVDAAATKLGQAKRARAAADRALKAAKAATRRARSA